MTMKPSRPVLHRRDFLTLGAAAVAAPWLPGRALAAVKTGVPLHGLSAFGDLKYGPDFAHFDYASPDAPKGGTFNFSPPNWQHNQSVLTFNTLNSFVLKGDAPPRMEMCFDALMGAALDEPDSLYGLAAETVTVSEDRNTFDFRIRPEARFHDGSPLTAEDVAFTYRLLKEQGHPDFLLPLADMTAAEADGETFRLVLNGEQSPRLILSLAGFPILSKADIEANGFEGSPLRPLLGSGPYKVGRVFAGQTIEYDRVPDYWGRDLPINRGFYHFDRLRIEFYGDRQAAFEAFKKGVITYRQEFTSRVWATGYDFPALNEGKVVKREFPSELRPSMQAWAVNQRRERFRDPRVRQAVGLCFDFEWTRRNLFYGAYERSQSTFERSPYKAEGLPSPEEMAILGSLRGKIPEEAFGEPVMQPVSDGSGRDRRLLGQASRLLAEAGWSREGGILVRDGQPLTLEILVQDDAFVRIDTPFVQNMQAIGIDASVRMVDSTQYEYRQNDFDFDMISMAASFTATPTRDELVNFFHSQTADVSGSNNLPGTADPALDSLIELVGAAQDRESLTVAMRVLDRVLRARRDWIPNWYAANHRAAFWDMFGFKEPKPDYGFPVEALWWLDEDKARAIGRL
jgi:microcin C transport system substrate-binding protein